MKTPITSEGLRETYALILTPLIAQIFHGDNSTSEKIHEEMDKALDGFVKTNLADRKALIEGLKRAVEIAEPTGNYDVLHHSVSQFLDSLVEKECCTECWGWKASESPKEGYCVRKFCKCHKVEKEK